MNKKPICSLQQQSGGYTAEDRHAMSGCTDYLQHNAESCPHMQTKAIVSPTGFPVRHTVRLDVGREFLSFDVPNGWDDVKLVCKRVLLFEDREFVFAGWNSDRNECMFFRPLNVKPDIASWK